MTATHNMSMSLKIYYILANSLLILRWIFKGSLRSPKASRVDTSVVSSAYMIRSNTDPDDIRSYINMLKNTGPKLILEVPQSH